MVPRGARPPLAAGGRRVKGGIPPVATRRPTGRLPPRAARSASDEWRGPARPTKSVRTYSLNTGRKQYDDWIGESAGRGGSRAGRPGAGKQRLPQATEHRSAVERVGMSCLPLPPLLPASTRCARRGEKPLLTWSNGRARVASRG